MERGFDLSNPDEVFHDIFFRHGGDNESERKANLWSYIAAHAHTVAYDYERILHFIEFSNAYQCMHSHSDKWIDLPSPDPIEYLEILEFTAESLKLAVKDNETRWEWPKKWGHVDWNCNISSSFPRAYNEPWWDITKNGSSAVAQAEEAIVLHKKKFGHRQPLLLSASEKLLISEMLNLFVPLFEEIPVLPPVLSCLDRPPMSVRNENETLDTDGLLGEYIPGRHCEILIYQRGIKDCSARLSLPKLALRELVIIHELAHWVADQIPLSRGRSINNHERWSDLSYQTADGSTTCDPSGFEVTEKEVHEGWAQTVTFYTLLMGYNDRCRNSIAPLSLSSYAERDGKGCLYAFTELNEHQSKAYHVWNDILAFNKTPQQVIGTLKDLRLASPGATMSQWRAVLAALPDVQEKSDGH